MITQPAAGQGVNAEAPVPIDNLECGALATILGAKMKIKLGQTGRREKGGEGSKSQGRPFFLPPLPLVLW